MRSITYFGHSCFQVKLGNIVMLFNPAVADPLAGSPRLVKSALNHHAVRECDLVFLSNEDAANCEPDTEGNSREVLHIGCGAQALACQAHLVRPLQD